MTHETRKQKGESLTAAQQNSPQHVSPATQKLLTQQLEPMGMQKGVREVEFGMQHSSVV